MLECVTRMPRFLLTMVGALIVLPLAALQASRPDDSVPPAATAPATSQPAASAPATQAATDLFAVMETPKGEVRIRLAWRESSRTAAYFINLVNHGIYDNYHVSGGRPQYKTDFGGAQDIGDPGATIRPEFSGKLKFTGPGDVGMQLIRQDTVGATFFITTAKLNNRDLTFPILGHVVSGMDVVTRMGIGDEVTRIRIEGDPSRLMAKYASQIAQWDRDMQENPTAPGASSTK